MRTLLSTKRIVSGTLDAAACAALRSAGFDALELFLEEPQIPFRDPVALKTLAAVLKESKIAASAVFLPFSGERSVLDADDARREAALSEAELGLDAAETLGTTLAVLRIGAPNDADTAQARVFVEEAIARISGYASPRGIEITLVNLGGPLTSVARLAEAIENVGRSMVGICVDVAVALKEGDLPSELRAAGRELLQVRLSGPAHAPALRRSLDELRFEGVVTLEAGTLESAAALRSAMRG